MVTNRSILFGYILLTSLVLYVSFNIGIKFGYVKPRVGCIKISTAPHLQLLQYNEYCFIIDSTSLGYTVLTSDLSVKLKYVPTIDECIFLIDSDTSIYMTGNIFKFDKCIH